MFDRFYRKVAARRGRSGLSQQALRRRAEAAEADLANARQRLAAVEDECQALAKRWMRNESISADYQNALADAAEELREVFGHD